MSNYNRTTERLRRCLGLIVVASISAGAATNVSAETARGAVYVDKNANQQRDTGEPGVENVRVSDGVRFATTDSEGNYSLNIGDEAILFVIKPSGYKTPVSEHNLPRFYYIHQPKGSPEGLRFKGIAPTGDLPERIDFPLTPQDEPSVFEAILLSLIHI